MAKQPPVVGAGNGHTVTSSGSSDVESSLIRPGQLLTQRIDLFGLGLDYAMYTKVKWGSYDQDDLSPWFNLGGKFISAPASIAWAGQDRIDVFGVGTDHVMYTKTRIGSNWTPDWQRLGGTFTSAASIVTPDSHHLELFVRGSDFTLRRNQYDGSSWFGWQNLGGSLASPPVAVSWAPNRLDVFALFNDSALWHRWWDGQVWNDWESLGGKYTGEPAVAPPMPGHLDVFVVNARDNILYQHSFSDNTWSMPWPLDREPVVESATVIRTAPKRLEVFAPNNKLDLRYRMWDGQAWNGVGAVGVKMRFPSRYRFSVDLVKVNITRSLSSDTNGAGAILAVGNCPSLTKTQWIGDMGGLGTPKEAQTNRLNFGPFIVDPSEGVSFGYQVVNNGNSTQVKFQDALAKAGASLNQANVVSLEKDFEKYIEKIVTVKITGAIAVEVPVVGSALAFLEQWLLQKLDALIFESCDGIVAVENLAMTGRDLFMMTNNGKQSIKVTTKHLGTDSPSACGQSNSNYEVNWTITPK